MTDSTPDERSKSQTQPSLAALAFGALGLVAIGLLAVEAFPGIQNALARAAFAFADSQWSEGPLILQLHRLALGRPAFMPTVLANSYDYGPLYVVLLGSIRRLASLSDQVATYRALSMCLGVLAVVPLACAALAIAIRGGIARSGAAKLAVAAATVALALAVFARSITFDTLHPDNLATLVIASSLAIHFAIAARAIRPAAVWALVAVGIAAAFGKQNAVVVVPLLIIGLAGAQLISLRFALIAIGVTVLGVVGLIAVIPADVRAWTVFVPLGQPYELTPPRIADAWRFISYWEPYLALGFVPTAVMLWVLGRRIGARALAVDAAALSALVIVACTGFFKTLGIWNNLTSLALGTVPYAGAVIGAAFGDTRYDLRRALTATLACASLLAIGLSLRDGLKQVPDAVIDGQLRAVNTMAAQLCATKQTILVTAFPAAFFGCPTAEYALEQSYLELQVAYPRYYVGPTVFDRPANARYVVAVTAGSGPKVSLGLRPVWARDYPRVVKDLPAVAGWGANYFPIRVKVFEHR